MTAFPAIERIPLLCGDSEMAQRMRAFDWSATGLGSVEQWPQALRTSVSTCLESAFPFAVWWGPELITFYNDEYQSVLGAKHPAALGARAPVVWEEIWSVIGPMLRRVMEEGKATRSRDLLLHLERNGCIEEAYLSFSYSPIYDDNGGVSGVFCPVIETTERVIGERRLRTLRDLAAQCRGAESERDACRSAMSVLAANRRDVPFALLYLIEADRPVARLASATGIEPGAGAAPETVELDGDADGWALGHVVRSGRPRVLDDVRARFDDLPTGAWAEPPPRVLVLPVSLPGQERPRAILVAAASPQRPLDDDYRIFFELIATQISRALAVDEQRAAADLAGLVRLQEVSTRLVGASDATPLLLDIVDAAIALTGADMGNIQLWDADLGGLKIEASRGFAAPFLDYFRVMRDLEAACGAATRAAARVVVEDVEVSPIFVGTPALAIVRAAGVRAVESTPLLDRSGRLVGVLSTHYRTPRRPAERDLRILDTLARQAADFIERTNAERALRASEERFRRYFELGIVGMVITSPAKGCLEANDRVCEMFGYSREEIYRLTWAELTHPDDLRADVVQFERVLAGEIDGYAMDKRFIRRDGSVMDATINVSCVRRPDGSVDYFVALVDDVTERKRTEVALRDSEARFRSLISQVRDYAIFATDERGIVTTWNEGCQHVLGYAEEEFVGFDSADLFSQEDRANSMRAAELRQAAEVGAALTERWMVAKGGARFFAMGATTALRGDTGRLTGFSTVMRDVTTMKISQDKLAHHGESLERLVTERTHELERTTERLRLSERMASLGTLSAGLGHDMGNLLLPLDIRLKLLLDGDLAPDLREHVLGIRTCAQYLQRLSSGLRLLAIDPWAARADESTELASWWNDVGMMLRSVLPPGVHLAVRFPARECRVAIGQVALTQAVFNLVHNAGDSLRERGTGQVEVSAREDPVAESVVVRVTDDGPGMADEVVRRCTEPYFSTKTRGISTGLGLAFVRGLVIAVGGRIEIDSQLGRGTTISLILPAAPPEDEAGDVPASSP